MIGDYPIWLVALTLVPVAALFTVYFIAEHRWNKAHAQQMRAERERIELRHRRLTGNTEEDDT